MSWLIVFAVIMAGAWPVAAAEQPVAGGDLRPAVTFAKLKDALGFIDAKLEKEDWEALSHALYPPLMKGDPNRTDWKELKAELGKRRLVDRFAKVEFPPSATTYDLGASPVTGTRPEGWSRITFVKVNKKWCISAFWVAR